MNRPCKCENGHRFTKDRAAELQFHCDQCNENIVCPVSSALPRIAADTIRRFVGAHESAAKSKAFSTVEEGRAFSAFQASLGLALGELESAEAETELWAPEHPTICLLQSYLAECGSDAAAKQVDEVKYDDRNLAGWAGSVFSWWRRFKKVPFVDAKPVAEKLADHATLAMFGDWGSGRYGAPVIAATVDHMPDVSAIIHLGDVYYAGTERQFETQLLNIWPQRKDARSFLLNGNHEMYGGGIAYFDAGHRFGQHSSHFALQNQHFLVVALDTAYEEWKLAGQQTDWLEKLVAQAGQRKLILLSHHQPLSAFEKHGAEKLAGHLAPLLDKQRVHAWYWGHEHRLAIYEPHSRWGLYGRCIGHGGYPYFRVSDKFGTGSLEGLASSGWRTFAASGDVPRGQVLADSNPYVPDKPERYGAHGFCTLVFNGPSLKERMHRPDGTVIFEQEIAK